MPRVFVSHSHTDSAFCREYVAGLRQQGLDVWYDEHNLGSGVLRAVIDRELEGRQHFVVIFSPAALASDWVNAEIDAAIDLLREGHMQTFLPVVAVKCAISPLLRRYKRIEGHDGQPVSVAEAIARTFNVIVPAAPTPTPPAPPAPTIAIPPTLARLG